MKYLATVVAFASIAGAAAAQTGHSGLDLNAIDRSVNPCQNFYQYACGTWIKDHPIPADRSSWNRFGELSDRIDDTLRSILEDAEKHEDRSADDQKIGGFYRSCMDTEILQRRGDKPLDPEMDRIRSLSDKAALVDEIARLQQRQIEVFFAFDTMPDPKNARMEMADIDQGGLGLPEKEYYTRTDPESQQLRKKYVEHIARMFELDGTPKQDAATRAATVMKIETDLAKASLDVTTRRNPDLLVHELPVSDLPSVSPALNLQTFFQDIGTPDFTKINVAVPDFFKALSRLIQNENLDDLKTYLEWHYLHASSTLLTEAFYDESFNFYHRILMGQKEPQARWKRCVRATDDELGDALGREFVERTFGKEGKQRTLQMVHDIEHAMQQDIESVAWMTPETKQQALIKLHAVTDKIGYPEKWRDYSSVRIDPDDYFGNWYRANQYESARQRNKIGKPVDRAEWGMTPPTVNAYYDPTENNINFPAGILQPPFYSNQADDAVNFGAIGQVVGHELTHAFDDQGRKFDADGNLKDWWQPADARNYEERSACLANEYSNFTVLPNLHVNGKLTLGENTADNGGLRLAYHALLDDLASKSVALTTKHDGYTEAQQFFLGFAQDWCGHTTPEAEREQVQTDPHSPPKFRVNGVVSNMPEFSTAFGCKAGDAMYDSKPCRVW